MHNVEIEGCSQRDTSRAALRFQGAVQGRSEIINSTVHNGFGWGINIESSSNIIVANSTIFNFRPMGFAVTSSRNITIDGNVLGGITERATFDAAGGNT